MTKDSLPIALYTCPICGVDDDGTELLLGEEPYCSHCFAEWVKRFVPKLEMKQ